MSIESAPVSIHAHGQEGSPNPFLQHLDALTGGPLIWLIFGLEMFTFALFFLGYAWCSRSEQPVFLAGQALLHPKLGTLNTLILLTGSWMAARAVLASHHQRTLWPWLAGTGVSGLLFMTIKLSEYQALFTQGISLSTDTFWFFYFFLTLLHNAHVALGVWFMFYLAWTFKSIQLVPEQHKTLETAAIYWHLVDIIWIFLFPLLYFAH